MLRLLLRRLGAFAPRAFQRVYPRAVRFPESFRGGCSFGASSKLDSPARFYGQLNASAESLTHEWRALHEESIATARAGSLACERAAFLLEVISERLQGPGSRRT